MFQSPVPVLTPGELELGLPLGLVLGLVLELELLLHQQTHGSLMVHTYIHTSPCTPCVYVRGIPALHLKLVAL